MLQFIARRLLFTVFVVLVVSFVTFVIFTILPAADPAALRAGRQPTPERIAQIRAELNLDEHFFVQFWEYMKGVVLHFDLGTSYRNNEEVAPVLLDRIPATVFLVIGGAFVWFISGVAIGMVSAIFRGRIWDRLLMGAALVAISAPVYWLGLVMLYLFSKDIGRIGIFEGSGAYANAPGFFDKAQALLLPWLVIAAAFAAIYARLLRSNLLETMSEDYIRTARAKGLSERRVIFRHGMRSAITPIITVLGLDIGILMGGAILTESVFNIPGIGRYIIDGIEQNDIPTVQGGVLFIALAVSLMSLLVDVIYAYLDPRVRY